MASLLSEFLSFKKTVESVGIRVKAMEDTDLEFSVYYTDMKDEEGNNLKVYSSSIHMFKTKEYMWMELPINIYLDNDHIQIELTKNPSVLIAEESLSAISYAC